MRTIAIIGAGFSGTMVAVHLLRLSRSEPLNIVLVERTGRFTAGVAYGTTCASHLLNVPAGRMSAFEDAPDHFLNWAKSQDATIKGGTFVPRPLYGKYLANLLNETEAAANDCQLLRVPGEAQSIASTESDQLTIDLGGGGLVRADQVVLAIGNFPPANPPVDDPTFYSSKRYARDPWAADTLTVSADQAVLLIGTGLTMLDMALALRDRGHRGAIHAISRRGLMPQPHRHSATPPPHHDRPAHIEDWPHTALGLCKALRAEVRAAQHRGVDWREVVTAIRADTPHLWNTLSWTERQRFLRHIRPFWETHRHRAAPQIAQQIQQLIDSGQLQVIAGRIISFHETASAVQVTIHKRHADRDYSLSVARVINCTGPDTDLSRVNEPLIVNLREQGIIRPDPLGLGLDATLDGAIISATGKPCRRLWLAGPLRKGQLWENTAVPELRVEAANLAARLLGHVASSTTRPTVDAGYALQC